MRKKINLLIIYCICVIIVPISIFGQSRKFLIVNIPDSVRHQLAVYIQEAEQLEMAQENIMILNAMMLRNTKFIKGVYYFRRMASHSPPRVFIYDGRGIFILKGDYVEALLLEINRFFLEKAIPKSDKPFYLKGLFKFIEANISELEE